MDHSLKGHERTHTRSLTAPSDLTQDNEMLLSFSWSLGQKKARTTMILRLSHTSAQTSTKGLALNKGSSTIFSWSYCQQQLPHFHYLTMLKGTLDELL